MQFAIFTCRGSAS